MLMPARPPRPGLLRYGRRGGFLGFPLESGAVNTPNSNSLLATAAGTTLPLGEPHRGQCPEWLPSLGTTATFWQVLHSK